MVQTYPSLRGRMEEKNIRKSLRILLMCPSFSSEEIANIPRARIYLPFQSRNELTPQLLTPKLLISHHPLGHLEDNLAICFPCTLHIRILNINLSPSAFQTHTAEFHC